MGLGRVVNHNEYLTTLYFGICELAVFPPIIVFKTSRDDKVPGSAGHVQSSSWLWPCSLNSNVASDYSPS